jgi:hypothetical protein
MRMFGRNAVAALAAAWLAAGCLGPTGGRIPTVTPPVEIPPPATQVPTEMPPVLFTTGTAVTVVWAPRAGTPPSAVIDFLSSRPDVRVGLLLPAGFFGDDETSRRDQAVLAELSAQRRVDIILTLPGGPVLPLIHDTDFARIASEGLPLPARFQWPDDVVAQVVTARGLHRRRWRVVPSVMEIPGGAAVGPELAPLGRLGVKWFYAGARGRPGLYQAEGALVATGALFPSKGSPSSRHAWLAGLLITDEAGARLRCPVQLETAEDVTALEGVGVGLGLRWVLPSELTPVAEAEPWVPSNLSSWIGRPDQNRAWQLLGICRRAVEDFKNSGKADVRALDTAVRGIYASESGDAFLQLGGDAKSPRMAEVKREYLAGLEQVFRFLNAPPPGALRQGFAGGTIDASTDTSTAQFSFHRSGDALIWKDPTKDDRGPGDYFYPTGAGFPTGVWDLTSFRVTPGDADVVFRYEMAASANPGAAPYGFSLAMVDTYIDINQLPGAGEDALLSGRPGLVEPQNAWEYALTVDGWGARLYQPWPGGAPRRVATLPVKFMSPSSAEVSVPRKYLRGEPSDWGFAVVVMGRASTGAESAPMPVRELSTPTNFGGAMVGRAAPPFIDVLTDEANQTEVLSVYKQGRDVVLPFVRAEE